MRNEGEREERDIQGRSMWEYDTLHLENGVYEVQARLHFTPEEVTGTSDMYEWVTKDLGWTVGTSVGMYTARPDGTILEYQDESTRLFTTQQEAIRSCIDAIQEHVIEEMFELRSLQSRLE